MPIFYSVPQSHCIIIERFGKFTQVKMNGLRFVIPFLDHVRNVRYDWGAVANKNGYYIELSEQLSDTGKRVVQTRDNVTCTIDAVIYWIINDPEAALYKIDHLPQAVMETSLNSLRSTIGSMKLDEILSGREQINAQIAQFLQNSTKNWGMQINRVEIQEIITDDDTVTAMRQQMNAERRSRAMVLESKGEAIAAVHLAKAEKEAIILRAEGEAEAKKIIAKADADYLENVCAYLKPAQAANLLAAEKYMEGFRIISQNSADKVFLPNSFDGIFSLDTKSENKASNQSSPDPLKGNES